MHLTEVIRNLDIFTQLCAMTVNLLTFATGIVFSWSSPALPKLMGKMGEDENPLDRPITTNEVALMVALVFLGAVIGCPIAGVLASKLGKKKALLISGVPLLVCFLMKSFATNVYYFLLAKFLGGISAGSCFTLVPLYVGEIAHKSNRGMLGCFFGIFIKSGVVFSYIVGPYLSVKVFSLICSVPVIIFLACFSMFFPESPYFLILNARSKDAEKTLLKLRKNIDLDEMHKELNEIDKYLRENCTEGNKLVSLLKTKASRKSLILGVSLMFIQEFSGISIVISYMQTIFQEAGDTLRSDVASIIVGLLQVVMVFVTSQIVDRSGRRILLIISSTVIILCLFTLGLYFYLKNRGCDVQVVFWIPLLSLSLFMIAYCIGNGPVVWALMGEIFDSNTKEIGSAIANGSSKFVAFILTLVFPYISLFAGMEGCFWLLACLTCLSLIFTVLFVPETKCKSAAEIKQIFEGRLLQI